jgi:hypothetical protein
VPLSFSKFDPALGRLTQVDLGLTANVDTSFTFSGGAPGPVSLKVYDDTFSLSVTDSGHLITMPQISGVSLVPSPNGTNANGSYFG